VVRHSAALLSLAVLCNGSDALARNPRDVFDQFAGIPQLVVTQAVQAESPDAAITCVEQNLRPRGSSISALIELGIPTSNGRVAPERASCLNQMGQSIHLTRLTSVQADPYGVDGSTLGSKVAYGTPAYQPYKCVPSQKFEGFVWCTKSSSDKEARGRFKTWFSILHAQDGAVVYVNRYQEPAYWSANEVADDIERYSRKIGEEPHIIQLPVRPGLPKGALATWGKVVLEPIVGDELRLLGEDKPLKKGIAIDFIGNFTQSARQGLPIYRLAGGAGFVWAASYNQSGRGTLRFSAVDASTYSPQSLPPPATTPAPVAADPPGGAATAVDAQPTSPPGTASPPPHRGEHLDCSAAPDCDAPTPAHSSFVAPPRDPNDVIAQVLNYSTMRLQQTLLFLSFLCITGFLAGAWLRRARTRTQVAAARAAEDARRATEVKAAEDARRAAEAKAAEEERRAAEAKAAEEERRAAEGKVAEDARYVAEMKAAEDMRCVAEMRAAEDARRVAEVKAEDARRAAEVKAAEDTRRVAEAKTAKKARPVAKAKAAKEARRAAEVKAAEEARSAAATRPRKRPEGMAAPPSGKADNFRLIKGIVPKPRARSASQKRTAPRMLPHGERPHAIGAHVRELHRLDRIVEAGGGHILIRSRVALSRL
jgi:hypothetical protein